MFLDDSTQTCWPDLDHPRFNVSNCKLRLEVVPHTSSREVHGDLLLCRLARDGYRLRTGNLKDPYPREAV